MVLYTDTIESLPKGIFDWIKFDSYFWHFCFFKSWRIFFL